LENEDFIFIYLLTYLYLRNPDAFIEIEENEENEEKKEKKL